MADSCNTQNPENDETFQRKVVEYRLRERVTDLLQERLYEEIQLNKRAEKYVVVATGEITVRNFELCTICAREITPSGNSFTFRACLNCRTFDSVLGSEFEGEMFLPLGRDVAMHSPSDTDEPYAVAQQAHIDAVDAIVAQWKSLVDWRASEVRKLAGESGLKIGETVTLAEWQFANPPSREASLDAYLRLIETSHAWVFGLSENSRSREWFTQNADEIFRNHDVA